MANDDKIHKPLTELGPCGRCGRPTFREHLPIVTVLREYQADKSLRGAVRNMDMGVASQFPVMIAQNFWPMDVDLSQTKEVVLCFRCSIALAMFLEGLSEEETREYDIIDNMDKEVSSGTPSA